ncbi:hypothetical protein [Haloarchaeobius sp. TZWWS8]|uniref:hypothetical protein n=1 Tax=Haloarchaeobius sp. TZWWS8 TaxID=3446121 RepID=UPI003EBE8CC8
MSSAPEAPELDEESRHEKNDAPDPRTSSAEEFAEIEVSQCQADNRHGNQCGRDSIPGTYFCPLHLPEHADDTELLKQDGIIHADDLTEEVDGVIVATTDTTNLRYRLEASDDAILHPIDDGESVTMLYQELAAKYKQGEIYCPEWSPTGFCQTLEELADTGRTNYTADARDPIEAGTTRGELQTDGGLPESELTTEGVVDPIPVPAEETGGESA